MFLKGLSNEEKKNFLELAVRIAQSDEAFSDEERHMIEEYKYEMNLDYDPPLANNSERAASDLIDSFKESDNKTIKKIFVELIGLILVDKEFAEAEKVILKDFMKKYGLSNEYLKKVQDWVGKLNELYAEGIVLIEQ